MINMRMIDKLFSVEFHFDDLFFGTYRFDTCSLINLIYG